MFQSSFFKQTINLFLLLFIMLISAAPSIADDLIILTSRDNSPLNAITESVVDEAYRRIGKKVKFERFPGNRSILMANSGKADGEVSRLRFVIKKYQNLRVVPVPVFHSELVALTKNPAIKINGWESLTPFRTVAPGSFKLVWNKLKSHKKVTKVADALSAINKLIKEEADVAILNKYEAERLIDIFGYRDIIVNDPSLETKPIYHLLHKKNEYLIQMLSNALTEMTDDGTMQTIWENRGAQLK